MVEEVLSSLLSKIADKQDELIKGLNGVNNEDERSRISDACDILSIINEIINSVYDEL